MSPVLAKAVRHPRRTVSGARSRVLEAVREPLTVVRDRIVPQPPDPVVRESWVPPSDDPGFFSLNSLASRCRHVFDYGRLVVNEDIENNWYFCKTSYLEYFFAHLAPSDEFVLLSGNSDQAVGRRYARHLRRPNLVAWFATNLTLRHPKAFPLALGMANRSARWPNGNTDALRAAQEANLPKTRLVHAGFSLYTNPKERSRCLHETGVPQTPPAPFETYAMQLAESFFCLSPAGKGIDCNRTWEALYLKAIPIVTRSLVADAHRDFPIVILDDWSQLRTMEPSPELYGRLWGDWSREAISLDGYVRRIADTAAAAERR